MSKSQRQKTKDLIATALDERGNDKERLVAALAACKLIDKYSLLDSPFEELVGIDNESISAAVQIFERATDPELVSSLKKVVGAVRGRRKRR